MFVRFIEKIIIEQVRQGNQHAFARIYKTYEEPIYRFIYFRVGGKEIAQDLTSEVFLKSWEYVNRDKASSNKQLANPRAFFYQVARNLITDFYRQKDKSPLSLEEVADKVIADKQDGPLEQAAISLDMESVKAALGRLNEDYRDIVIWRYLDEMEIKEIAQIMEKSDGAVRVLLSRALSNLKGVLNGQLEPQIAEEISVQEQVAGEEAA